MAGFGLHWKIWTFLKIKQRHPGLWGFERFFHVFPTLCIVKSSLDRLSEWSETGICAPGKDAPSLLWKRSMFHQIWCKSYAESLETLRFKPLFDGNPWKTKDSYSSCSKAWTLKIYLEARLERKAIRTFNANVYASTFRCPAYPPAFFLEVFLLTLCQYMQVKDNALAEHVSMSMIFLAFYILNSLVTSVHVQLNLSLTLAFGVWFKLWLSCMSFAQTVSFTQLSMAAEPIHSLQTRE